MKDEESTGHLLVPFADVVPGTTTKYEHDNNGLYVSQKEQRSMPHPHPRTTFTHLLFILIPSSLTVLVFCITSDNPQERRSYINYAPIL
jgi:hypothetical protein